MTKIEPCKKAWAELFPVAADRAIIIARRRILDIIASPDKLASFRQAVRDGRAYGARPLDVVSEIGDVTAFVDHFRDDLFAY
jgi:phthalate 4,5-dioxygenase